MFAWLDRLMTRDDVRYTEDGPVANGKLRWDLLNYGANGCPHDDFTYRAFVGYVCTQCGR